MYDLHRLRVLRELKLRGTLTAVADALSYSPSTISQQLGQLEIEVGVKLIEPVGRKVRLTAEAEILVAHTEHLMARLERAESDIAAVKTEVAGSVRVAAFQTASLTLIPDMLIVLLGQHPRLRVEVIHRQAQDALSAVLARDCDLAVGEEYPGQPVARADGLDFNPLRMDTMRVVAPEDYTVSDGQQPGLAALAQRPWAMEPSGTAARQWAVALCRDAGFEPDIQFESADVMFHRRLVERGLAAAFLPDLLRKDDTQHVSTKGQSVGARRIFTAVRQGASTHPAILACRKALISAANGPVDTATG